MENDGSLPQSGRGVNQILGFVIIAFVIGFIIGAIVFGALIDTDYRKDQNLNVGDYLTYEISGSSSGIVHSIVVAITDTQITYYSTSTASYYSDCVVEYDYWIEDGIFKCPDLYGPWIQSPSLYKTGETDIDTPFGTKHVSIYSYYQLNAERTAFTTSDCHIPYQFITDDQTGNHIFGKLIDTNIEWLK